MPGDLEERTEAALARAIAAVQTEAQARETIAELERVAGTLCEGDIEDCAAASTPERRAEQIEQAANGSPADAISQVAAQLASTPPDERQPLDDAIQKATGTSAEPLPPDDVRRARQLLRKELIRTLRPLDAVDTILYVGINHLPHPRIIDRLVNTFSWAMTGGAGYLAVLAAVLVIDPRRGAKACLGVLPALCLSTSTVEYPIKHFFRRRRPFISIVRAIVVGRKPGSFSFPSGHTAAAFAGAALLCRFYPRHRLLFRAVACLVGFSRVYLGAHYPGDVVSGACLGVTLSRIFCKSLGVLARTLLSK